MKTFIATLLIGLTASAGQLSSPFTTEVVQSLLTDTYEKVGVYAYLTIPDDTTCTVTGAWYAIEGTFTNDTLLGFTQTATNIVCNSPNTSKYEIDFHVAVASSANNTTAHVGIMINDSVYTDEKMGTFCKNLGQAYAFSGTVVAPIANGDTVQLVCQSEDIAGAVLSFKHFETSLNKFFIRRD